MKNKKLENKKVLAKNLQYYMDLNNISRNELIESLDLKYMTLSDWLNAKTYPRIDKIELLANYFNINKSDLIEDKIDLSKIDGIIPLEKAKRIPILGRIACGEPIFADENYEGYFIADSSIKASFALKAKGDSMIDANINDGDLVLLRKDFEFVNGNIYAVLIDDEATLKRVYKTGNTYTLNPANVNYQPIVLTDNEEAMILGEMVGVYQTRNK